MSYVDAFFDRDGAASLNDVDGEFLDSGSDLRFDFFKIRIVIIMHYFVDREARQEDLVVASVIAAGVCGDDAHSFMHYNGSVVGNEGERFGDERVDIDAGELDVF